MRTTSRNLQHQTWMLLFNCRSAQQSPPASAQSHLLWTMTNQTEITTIPQLLAPSGCCYLNLTQLAQTTEWRASGIQQRINILCFGTKNRTIILNSLQQDFMHMNVCITVCMHSFCTWGTVTKDGHEDLYYNRLLLPQMMCQEKCKYCILNHMEKLLVPWAEPSKCFFHNHHPPTDWWIPIICAQSFTLFYW